MPIDDDDTLEPEGQNGPKALREAYDKAKKDLEDLRKERDELRTAKRQVDIGALLKQNDAPERLSKYALRDIEGEVTAETVLSWLTENGGDFGWEAPDPETDEVSEQAERVAAATAAAPPSRSGTGADLMHKLRTLPTAELIAQGLIPSM